MEDMPEFLNYPIPCCIKSETSAPGECCDECDYLLCCTNCDGLCDKCFAEHRGCPLNIIPPPGTPSPPPPAD